MSNDPHGLHAASAAAWKRLADLDHQLATYRGDEAGRRDLSLAAVEIVRVHGQPQPDVGHAAPSSPAEIAAPAAVDPAPPPPPLNEVEALRAEVARLRAQAGA